ncbi:MAG: nuclear transport factor 2 family protein [Demequina sp.]
MRKQEVSELVSLERRGWEALTSGRAREFYDEVLTSDAVMVFPFGVMERADAIDSMAEFSYWRDYELDDITVHDLGAGLAVVVYRVRARRGDDDPPFEAMLSSTYVRARGGWQMMLHQQSPAAVRALSGS